MGHCESYLQLSEVERQVFDTSLLHVVRSDNEIYEAAKKLIARGEKKKLFSRVTIRPNGLDKKENV